MTLQVLPDAVLVTFPSITIKVPLTMNVAALGAHLRELQDFFEG